MTDARPRPSRSRAGLAAIALLAALVVALLIGSPGGLPLANPDRTAASQLRSVIARIPRDATVLVAFDPDIGTYPEIRFAVRSVLDDLLAHGSGLAVVSYTPEGRALALAELERLLGTGAPASRLLDLGFRTGAEAGLVTSVASIVPGAASGPLADALRARGGGLQAFDLALIIAGGDVGPRSWVEQIGTRVRGLPLVAVSPTSLRPELEPYLATGQLAALLGTLRDDAAYASSAESPAAHRPPGSLAILVGMLAALIVLLQAGSRGIQARVRRAVSGRERW
ncbi:MAG: hypothetical protein M3R05_05465 [Chloroflexota bacterium]|nr:hypothetical protein [Chloroflexota bacterium]